MRTPLLCFVLLAAGATAGHSAADVRSDARGVTLASDSYVTRVEVWTDRIVRVTRRPATATAAQGASLAVIGKPQDTDWRLADTGEHVTLTTPALRVLADKGTGAVQFLDTAGKRVLAETPKGSSFTPATVGGASTWRVRQTFELDPDEGIFGLGQHPDGFMNHRGTNVHLQQENRVVAVPVLVSSRGYGRSRERPTPAPGSRPW
jgi:alpha-D-xyloside xylohydrolase